MKPAFAPACLPLLLFAAILLAGCSHYATVSEREVRQTPAVLARGPLAGIGARLQEALRLEKHQPREALGVLLEAAAEAAAQVEAAPADPAAREAYNFAVARVLGNLRNAGIQPWKQALDVPAPGGSFRLTHKHDPRPGWNPALFDLVPADQFDVGGKYVAERSLKAGVGAPTVAVGLADNPRFEEEFTMRRIFYGVTAVIRFNGRHAELAFEDPLATETVKLGRRTLPLAADYTVPLAVMLAETEPKKLELSRLLNPEKYAETARIARLQPYDPAKSVVLVVHGLMDSPATWTPILNHLRSDPDIRRNFQFWFYSYPSGYPYPHSAAILRRDLDAIQHQFPLAKPMVVIGHSMGGCISRLLITDPGDRLWRHSFGKAPEETPMDPSAKQLFSDALLFKPRPEVGRVIFISAPLRGSEFASSWIGRLGTRLVKSPATLAKAGESALKLVTFQSDDLKLKAQHHRHHGRRPRLRRCLLLRRHGGSDAEHRPARAEGCASPAATAPPPPARPPAFPPHRHLRLPQKAPASPRPTARPSSRPAPRPSPILPNKPATAPP
jgi:pimeloyl-ACP methyl ester carboxylesterase